MKKQLNFLITGILIIIILLILGSVILNYNIKPVNIYLINNENLIYDGSFENFNQTVGDCCNGNSGTAVISASKSEDSILETYSLNLTSSNHCACIYDPIINFNKLNKYLLSFYYKGDNPEFCTFVSGDNQCMPKQDLNQSYIWMKDYSILTFSDISKSASIYFYADSDGTKTTTNLYDDLEVHQLMPINSDYNFQNNESYIIKTKVDNNVKGKMIGKEDTNGDAYFLISGKPNVTIKFPWTELIIVIIIMLIIIRLLFKKQEEKFIHAVEKDFGIKR
jgi:hypothetical protein